MLLLFLILLLLLLLMLFLQVTWKNRGLFNDGITPLSDTYQGSRTSGSYEVSIDVVSSSIFAVLIQIFYLSSDLLVRKLFNTTLLN